MTRRFALLALLCVTACYHGRPEPFHVPAAPFNTESYQRRHEASFARAADEPLSTFSVDVDTASYANVRRFLRERQAPPPDAVRLEELVNYFPYDLPGPRGDDAVAISTEVGPCPWQPRHRLVRVGLKAREAVGERPRWNLTFLVDVSGSMASERKLPLLKRALALLVEQMTDQDRLAVVVYAGASGLALPPTSGAHKQTILETLARLEAGGSTNGGDGIDLAYRVAADTYLPGGINRVILATDGDFNVGVASPGDLVRLIERRRGEGIDLTVLGLGMGNLKDDTLESLAHHGDGNYAYIDSLDEARKVLVEDVARTMHVVARDVKVQVELNPAAVARYRLLGYENRLLTRAQFADTRADAGDMGAGQSVTALYEIEPTRGQAEPPTPLRYQTMPLSRGPAGEIMSIHVRYKDEHRRPREQKASVPDDPRALPATSADFRFAAAVAVFGLVLRGSPERGQATLGLARELAASAVGLYTDEHRREFVGLLDTARELGENTRTRRW